jgi:hypothetical protein
MRTRAVPACILVAAALASAGAAESAAPVEAPAWVKAIAPGTWVSVSKNTPADVDPAKDPKLNPNHPKHPPWGAGMGQRGVIECWNGGALATRHGAKGSLLIYGGGHHGYYGNEVYAFDLEKCLWSRVTDPYAGPLKYAEGKDAYPEGRHPDGSPTPIHTYDGLGYHPGSNAFIPFCGEKNNLGGYHVDIAYLLSLDARKWQHSPRNDKPYGLTGWSAYDSARDVFWLEGCAKFDPNVKNADGTVGRWTNYGGRKLKAPLDSTGAYDPVRDIVVIVNFRTPPDQPGVFAMDPKNPAGPAVRLKESGTRPPSGGKEGAAGWEWSPLRGAFLFWRRGAELRECRPPASDWKSGKWTWSMITDTAANKAEPEAMKVDNGVYSRFQIAHYADAEVAVVINNIAGPVWAFRVPEPAKGR